MDRNDELILLEFCAKQHAAFRQEDWRGGDRLSDETLAAAALFLAHTNWFGQADALREVAERLAPALGFPELVRRTRFDFARFEGMLKMRLRHACALS